MTHVILPADVRHAIAEIVEYGFVDEEADYVREGEPEGHVFGHFKRVSDWLGSQSGDVEQLVARMEILKPAVERLPSATVSRSGHRRMVPAPLDQDMLIELIAIGRACDQLAADPRVKDIRRWLHANGLPTTYRPPKV